MSYSSGITQANLKKTTGRKEPVVNKVGSGNVRRDEPLLNNWLGVLSAAGMSVSQVLNGVRSHSKKGRTGMNWLGAGSIACWVGEGLRANEHQFREALV